MPFELPISEPLLQLALLLAVVLLVQVALERVFVPGLLGLLLVGMLLGPDGAGVLPREPVVELFGRIGLIYIMFTAGLEIDLDTVAEHKGETLGFGVLAFGASLLAGAGLGMALGYDWPAALLLGTLLSSHTLVAYPILKRKGLLGKRPAVAAIGGTVLTDTLALIGLVLLMQTAGGDGSGGDGAGGHGAGAHGAGDGPWWQPLALLAGLALAAITLLPRLARATFARDWVTPAEKALFALLALVVLAAAAELIGTEEILGGFIAGLSLNRVLAERPQTRKHVEFVGRMLFIPVFFVSTGMLLELSVFGNWSVWGTALMLCAVVVVGKSTAAWVIGARYGYSRDGRLLMVGLTLPQAAATLAITVAGNEAGLLDDAVVDAVIVVILLTCAAGPLLTGWTGSRLRAHEHDDSGAVNEPRI